MPRSLSASLLLPLGLGVALALGSCGEEDAQLLPGETAREITANLDAVGQLADEGDCVGAEAAAEQVSEQIDGLSGVDARLKQALEGGAERLSEVIVECEESASEAIAPAIIPEEAEEDEEKRPGEGGEGKGKGKGEEEDEGNGNGPPGDGEGNVPGGGEGNGPPDRSEGGPPPGGEGGEGEGGEGGGEEPSGGVSPGTPAGEGE